MLSSSDVGTPLPSLRVLAPCRARVEVLGQAHGGEDLLLLGPQRLRGEADRLLHGREGQELQEVVLDDVTGSPDAVVVTRPGPDADLLGHGDLDVVDVVGVPQRLEHRVREPHREDVLDRLLAEVVVDAEHVAFLEHVGDHPREFPGRVEVVPEGLLDDHPAPLVATVALIEARVREVTAHDGEPGGWDGQVEGVVAARAP